MLLEKLIEFVNVLNRVALNYLHDLVGCLATTSEHI